MKLNIFVKNITDMSPFVGKVWNTKSSVWPDFTDPKATIYWTKMMQDFYDQCPYSGVWIDMNEPSNVYDGQLGGCPQNDLETPPYSPGYFTPGGQTLQRRTLCMVIELTLFQMFVNCVIAIRLRNIIWAITTICTICTPFTRPKRPESE